VIFTSFPNWLAALALVVRIPVVRFLDTLLKAKAELFTYFNPIFKYAPGPGTLFSFLSLFAFAMTPKGSFIWRPRFDLKLKEVVAGLNGCSNRSVTNKCKVCHKVLTSKNLARLVFVRRSFFYQFRPVVKKPFLLLFVA
jgi:hypothetical protein